nr:hypothetical protein [Tanacetum cinerariifolium]
DDMDGDVQNDDFITKETKDSESKSNDEANHFDSVCAICDNDGGLVWLNSPNARSNPAVVK